jgi:hypothetical protein
VEDVLESVKRALGEWLRSERRKRLCHDQKGRRMTMIVARMMAKAKPRKSRIVSFIGRCGVGLELRKEPSVEDGLESLEGSGVLIALEVEVIAAVLEDLDAAHIFAVVEYAA